MSEILRFLRVAFSFSPRQHANVWSIRTGDGKRRTRLGLPVVNNRRVRLYGVWQTNGAWGAYVDGAD